MRQARRCDALSVGWWTVTYRALSARNCDSARCACAQHSDRDKGSEAGRRRRWQTLRGMAAPQQPLIAAIVACVCVLRPTGVLTAEPNYKGRELSAGGLAVERGVSLEDGEFWSGTTGSEWPYPEGSDLLRLEKKDDKKFTEWKKTSWRDINCCRRLREDADWEKEETGVPDCFCRDLLQFTGYKTTAWCNLKQSCENALRDWNKVFGEGYMTEGIADDWNTESPLRTCTSTDWGSIDGGTATHKSCGVESKKKNPPGPDEDEPWRWVDEWGRGPVYPQSEPSKYYGKKLWPGTKDDNGKEYPDTWDKNPKKAKATGFKWIPGDVPLRNGDEKKWQGFRAANGAVEEGMMSGSRVYPGQNHSLSCLINANSTECLESSFMKWTGPVDSYQADCMFAVKRAICAYHFWECDASYGVKIYNGICKPTCDDVPRVCGTIPSTGEPLEVDKFTLGGFYYLGCTEKQRQYVKDCTAGAEHVRASFLSSTMFALLIWAVQMRHSGDNI